MVVRLVCGGLGLLNSVWRSRNRDVKRKSEVEDVTGEFGSGRPLRCCGL